MDDIEFIKKIETEYDVSSIKVDNIQVWGLLRSAYISEYINKIVSGNEKNKSQQRPPINSMKKISRLRNILYGMYNFIRRYEIYGFSDTMEIREVNGKYINKLFDVLMDNKTFLLIENPVNGYHISMNRRRTKNIISLDVFTFLPQIITGKRKTIQNEDILFEINEKYGLQIDASRIVTKFFIYKSVFKFFLDIYRPKAIMLSCYYGPTYQSLIYASKEKNIPVIEMQHGSISKTDPFYISFIELENSFFPDYLLVWGENTKKSLQDICLIPNRNIFPVGSMYIEYMNKVEERRLVNKFKTFRRNYKHIVAVTSQYTVEIQLIKFIKDSATISSDILYLYIPRDPSIPYKVAFPKNIKIIKEFNAYQLIKYSDFHATVYSSCAIEAPALGIQNILININNEAKKNYSDILIDKNISRFVENEKEFVELIRSWKIKPKKKIQDLHKDFIAQEHSKSLSEALNYILSKEK